MCILVVEVNLKLFIILHCNVVHLSQSSKDIYGLCAYANITAGVVHSRASFHLGTGKVVIWKRFFMYVHRLCALHQCKSCSHEDQESAKVVLLKTKRVTIGQQHCNRTGPIRRLKCQLLSSDFAVNSVRFVKIVVVKPVTIVYWNKPIFFPFN